MTRPALPGWLRHPLAQALMRFNFMPALLLHPRRADAGVPAPLRSLPTLQRHILGLWQAVMKYLKLLWNVLGSYE